MQRTQLKERKIVQASVLFSLHVYWPLIDLGVLYFFPQSVVRVYKHYLWKKEEKRSRENETDGFIVGVCTLTGAPKEWLRVARKRIPVKREFKTPSFPNDHTHVLTEGKDPHSLSASMITACVSHLQIST